MENNAVKKYINLKIENYRYNLYFTLVAISIFIYWYSTDLYKIGSFSYVNISVGHIAYLGLLFIPPFIVLNNKIIQKLWIFFSTIAILDLPTLTYIVNEKNIDKAMFYSSLYISILILIFFIVSIYSVLSKNKNISEHRNYIWIVYISSIFFMILYHGMNWYLKIIKNVKNEDRSIFINGLEFHHISYGIILLILTPIIFKYVNIVKNKLIKIIIYIFTGFIYGTVFDESFYYMLQDVSDDAYLQFMPNCISILIMLISFIIWNKYLKKEINHA